MSGIVDINLGELVGGVGNLVNSIGNQIRGNVPVDLGKLAELEVKMKELQAQADKNTIDDRKSARELEAEYAKTGKTNWLQQFLGYGAVIMLAFIIIALFNFNIKPEIKDLLNVRIGGLLKIVYDLYGYYFGGSLGSENKNTMISDIMSKFKKQEATSYGVFSLINHFRLILTLTLLSICLTASLSGEAELRNVNRDVDFMILQIIEGESGDKVNAIGDHGKARGIVQYWKSTFYRHAKQQELPNAEYLNPQHQVTLLRGCLVKWGCAKEWSTYRRLFIYQLSIL